MTRSQYEKSLNGQEAESQIQEEFSEEEDSEEEEGISIKDYIKALKPFKLRKMIRDAEFNYKTKNLNLAIRLYEAIAKEYEEPLAYYRLGEHYLANKDFVKAHTYFYLALEKGWIPAIEKLLAIGEVLVQEMAAFKERSMSIEVQRMYL